ncbi:hypothetical protein V6Z12_A07G113600 [Gossypium hirsutum]
MPSTRFLGSLSTPRVDITIDTGNLFFNQALEGYLKIGSVAATRSIAEDSFKAINGGKLSKHCLERSLKKMCKEGAYWGSVAGVYVGMEYGVGRIRGTWDWNAMIGGALTGALVSAATNNNKDQIVSDALTGGAVATASVLLNYLT